MKTIMFEFNNKKYILNISDDLYNWTLEDGRHGFIWTKTNDEWTIIEKYKSKSPNANWYANSPTQCDCPEVEIEYQRYIREQKLNRIIW